ncbi:MAG: BolA/IbaG family iron-sulfur metabolism protein [Pseudomonadales bacterium]|jgi:acid stress-induced BolA-like protein IbaG/YrbA
MNEEIAEAVRAKIEGADVDVLVDGNRALITVVSDAFENLSRVQKQQKVYACIEEYIRDGRLHAVTIRAQTPSEATGS